MKTKAAILYHSYYGTTKQYAILISERLNCDIYDICVMDESRLTQYNTFIVCSSILHNKLTILPFLKKHRDKFLNNKVVLLATYMNDVPPVINADTLIKNIPIFYKEGRIDRSIHFWHLLQILIKTRYYHTYKNLRTKLLQPKTKSLQPVDDIVEYCIHTLHVDVPTPIKGR